MDHTDGGTILRGFIGTMKEVGVSYQVEGIFNLNPQGESVFARS